MVNVDDSYLWASILGFALLGCGKTEGVASVTGGPVAAPTIVITASPTAAPAAAVASVIPAASAPLTTASASAPPASSASAAKVVARASAAASAALVGTTVAKDLPPLKPALARLSGKNFTLDAASPGCRVDTPCTVTLRLEALGGYHVNKEYPYKFTAAAVPGVQFLGNGDANVFSRAAGDYHEEGEKAATLTVRFKPTASGEARVGGTYKMSVCSAENCQIEQQAVSLDVPVL